MLFLPMISFCEFCILKGIKSSFNLFDILFRNIVGSEKRQFKNNQWSKFLIFCCFKVQKKLFPLKESFLCQCMKVWLFNYNNLLWTNFIKSCLCNHQHAYCTKYHFEFLIHFKATHKTKPKSKFFILTLVVEVSFPSLYLRFLGVVFS